jgi:hypothetical protein
MNSHLGPASPSTVRAPADWSHTFAGDTEGQPCVVLASPATVGLQAGRWHQKNPSAVPLITLWPRSGLGQEMLPGPRCPLCVRGNSGKEAECRFPASWGSLPIQAIFVLPLRTAQGFMARIPAGGSMSLYQHPGPCLCTPFLLFLKGLQGFKTFPQWESFINLFHLRLWGHNVETPDFPSLRLELCSHGAHSLRGQQMCITESYGHV